jgi:hypothetical protein
MKELDKILVLELEENLGCPRHNLEDDSKSDLEVIWCEFMEWV